MSEAVEKMIVGTCTEIIDKPDTDWVKFNISVPGNQYPIGLSTKLDAIIAKGRAARSERAVWHFSESEGKENPNKPGTHFINRYLKDVVVGGEEADAAEGQLHQQKIAENTASGSTHPPLASGDRERSIVRQSCLKVAGALFSGLGNKETVDERDNVSELLAAADRLERWVYRDIDDVPFE